jgi:hypothetical protein
VADRPYTETFIRTSVNARAEWHVPAGFRAVITSLVAVNYFAGATGTDVSVNGHPVGFLALQAQNATVVLAMRAVAYQSEVIGTYCGALNVYRTISGYLFEDSSGATGPPGRLYYDRLEQVEPLPS